MKEAMCIARICAVLSALVLSGQLLADTSIAQSSDATEIKARILAEISGKPWIDKGYSNSGYTSDRFYTEMSFPIPPEYMKAAPGLLDALMKGEFDVILPTERGSALENVPSYLTTQTTCSSHPLQFWNGHREITQGEYEQRIYGSVVPYVPNRPRPVDYEFQFKGELTPYAAASESFVYYDLGAFGEDGQLALFGARNYVPLPSRQSKGSQLEGSFAAYETPHCYFLGTLDYFTRCLALRPTPVRQPDWKFVAEVIRLQGRPFILAIQHTLCEASEQLPSDQVLFLWDVTAKGPIPHILAFSVRARE
jgi:hypothetical protein